MEKEKLDSTDTIQIGFNCKADLANRVTEPVQSSNKFDSVAKCYTMPINLTKFECILLILIIHGRACNVHDLHRTTGSRYSLFS